MCLPFIPQERNILFPKNWVIFFSTYSVLKFSGCITGNISLIEWAFTDLSWLIMLVFTFTANFFLMVGASKFFHCGSVQNIYQSHINSHIIAGAFPFFPSLADPGYSPSRIIG